MQGFQLAAIDVSPGSARRGGIDPMRIPERRFHRTSRATAQIPESWEVTARRLRSVPAREA
jgi:hypothetical protein